jgi:hypothetical protein
MWFVVPAHGRVSLTRLCLQRLRWTCESLRENGIEASAIVVACDENLKTARKLGFGTYKRNNDFLSRRFNDGIQAACDPKFNPRPADFVVPCGSDDWVHPSILLDLPNSYTVVGFQAASFVREDGLELRAKQIRYPGGVGIRIYPRKLMQALGYRPADESRRHGCDTSILNNLMDANPQLSIHHPINDPRTIVDWKSTGEQINPFQSLARHRNIGGGGDPFERLADLWPNDALRQMRRHYGVDKVAV